MNKKTLKIIILMSFIALAFLFSINSVSATHFIWDHCDGSSGTISPGGSTKNKLFFGDTEDWYDASLNKKGYYRAYLEHLYSADDFDLNVYKSCSGSSGSGSLSCSNNRGTGFKNEKCEFKISSSTTYHLNPKLYSGGGLGIFDNYRVGLDYLYECKTTSDCASGQTCQNNVCKSQSCNSHSSYKCDSRDVYWYNSCNVREDKKQECGDSGYTSGNYCYDNDSYRDYTTKDCSGSSCTSNTNKEKQSECGVDEYGPWQKYCSGGSIREKRNVVDRGCSGGGCFKNDKTEDQLVKNCSPGYCTDPWWGDPYCECTAEYTGNQKCSVDTIQYEYRNSDCSLTWKNQNTCNQDSNGPWGAKYREGNQVKQKRTVNDNYCKQVSNKASCDYRQSQEVKIISNLGEDNFCSEVINAGQRCQWNEADCDKSIFGSDECGSGLKCTSKWFGGEYWGYGACCRTGEKFDGEKCVSKSGLTEGQGDCDKGFWDFSGESCASGLICTIGQSGDKEDHCCQSGYGWNGKTCQKGFVWSAKGSGNYCADKVAIGDVCQRQEGDCDSNSQCVSGLTCTGGIFSIFTNDICCGLDEVNKDGQCTKKTTCGNGVCEIGEDYNSCRSDCKATVCDSSKQSCVCKVDSDCAYGFFCSNGVCQKYKDECTNYNQYYCKDKNSDRLLDVVKCRLTTTGYKEATIDICGSNEECSSGKTVCNLKPVELIAELNIEEATIGTVVNKQIGDYLWVNVKANRDGKVNFVYPTQYFNLLEGNCANLKKGDNLCKFSVKYSTPLDTIHAFKVDNKASYVKVISSPKLLVITHKNKLKERYGFDAAVLDVLKEAYQEAFREKGVVYDIKDYISLEHPFGEFRTFDDDPLNPTTKSNDYSNEITTFVTTKCNGCEHTIILGDDYVIPFYRKTVTEEESFLGFNKQVKSKKVYSDALYSSLGLYYFGDIDYNAFFNKDRVYIVIPDSMNKNDPKLTLLKETLVNTYKERIEEYQCKPQIYTQTYVPCNGCSDPGGCKVGNPSLNNHNDIVVYESAEVSCQSHSKLDKATVIIIGNEEINLAAACYPWIRNPELPTLTLQKNAWDNNKGSIVLNVGADELDVGMEVLTNVIGNGYWRGITFNDPAFSWGEVVVGFVPLSDCDDAFDIGDNIFEIQSTDIGSFAFCVVDVGATLVTLPVGGWGGVAVKSGSTAVKIAVTGAKLAKATSILEDTAKGVNKLEDFKVLMKKQPKELPYIYTASKTQIGKDAFIVFYKETLSDVAKLPAKDFARFAKGTEKIQLELANGLDDFGKANKLTELEKLSASQKVGNLADVKGVEKVIVRTSKEDVGAIYELKHVSFVKDTGVDVKVLGEKHSWIADGKPTGIDLDFRGLEKGVDVAGESKSLININKMIGSVAAEWVNSNIIGKMKKLKEGAELETKANLKNIKRFKFTIDEEKLLHTFDDGQTLFKKIEKQIAEAGEFPFETDIVRNIPSGV